MATGRERERERERPRERERERERERARNSSRAEKSKDYKERECAVRGEGAEKDGGQRKMKNVEICSPAKKK